MTSGSKILVMLELSNEEARDILGNIFPEAVKERIRGEISKSRYERIKK